MRRFLALALCAALAACDAHPLAAPKTQDPGAQVLMGRYLAASETARARTGEVSIARGGLMFASGAILYTRVLEPRRGHDLIARDGVSYAAAALGASDVLVELRRVTEQRLDSRAQGLCDDATPAYIGLVYGPRGTAVTLLAFSGAEPPGPNATQSRLCATFRYVAPDGARTRQGVLLQ